MAQADHRFIFFLCAAQELRQPRRTARKHDQNSGGKWIESACVSDPALTYDPADSSDYVVRSYPRGLVDNQNAIHASHSSLWDPPCPLCLNLSPQRRGTQRRERQDQPQRKSRTNLSTPRVPASACFSAPASCSRLNNVRSR